MIELYWQSLTRDIPYSYYGSDRLIAEASSELSRMGLNPGSQTLKGTTTPDNVFRAEIPGCLSGPYISQFLLLPIPLDNLVVPQKYSTLAEASDRMTSYSDWIDVQNGHLPQPAQPQASPRFISTARDLASYVRRDFSCQAALNAALILASFGNAALSLSNPYKRSQTQMAFVGFGQPALIDWVARATSAALKACWYHKWLVHRRLRPEEFAGRVHNAILEKKHSSINGLLFRANILDRVYSAQGSYLLAQAYDEGCPIHPSYPAGHAAIAGACVTTLKAFVDEEYVIPEPVLPTPSGSALEAYSGESLKIGGELNKLAANVAMGRDAAGVHWRSDSMHGLRLGEAVAIELMRDILQLQPESQFAALEFHDFEGKLVSLAPQ